MKKLFRLLRYDWLLHFVLLLTNWLPDNTLFLRLRGLLSSKFLGSCGTGLMLGRNVTFYNPRKIRLGDDVYIAEGCILLSIGETKLGSEVMLAPYVVISAGNHSRLDHSYRYGSVEATSVEIGAGTWVGAQTTILDGAHIGDGCLIASNSAVTRGKIPSDHLVAGVPALIKRKLEG